ncbi:MAG TPA: energy transducer TonB [Opitutaceae bacterium]|nr:energy transducer TonB [Opitutaceae bacterium]
MKKLPLTLALFAFGAFSAAAVPAFDPASPEAVAVGRRATNWGPMPEYQVAPLKTVAPDYSAALKQKGAAGKVIAAALIGASGQVVDVTVVASSGDKKLDGVALAAFRQWRFPSLRDGRVPVRYVVKQAFEFKATE